ncbi:MAG TPA: CopD family protein [Burkholderiales bacterium]|jgi:Putative copper export protein
MFVAFAARCARCDVRRRLALVGWLLVLCVWAPVAHAHAALVASDPSDGAVLSAWPAHVALTFNEPISPLVFRLVSPDGVTHALDHVAPVDAGLHIELPAQTLQGTYALSWRVVSADGHPIGGTMVFSMGGASAAGIAADTDYTLRRPAIWLARLALYVGLFFGVGGAVFRAFMGGGNRAVTMWSRRAIWIGFAAIPICLVLQGLDALEAPWRGVIDANVWRAALSTSYAITLVLAVLALSVAFLTLSAVHARRIHIGAAATAVLLLGVALAASGHASAAPPQWLARPVVLLHGVAIAAWLGALMPLFALMRTGRDEVAPALQRFSRRIRIVVIILVITGVVLALLQVDRPAALWTTAYGQILLAKLSLVAGLFMLAAWNRYRLTDRVLSGNGKARSALGRIIAIEIALALCVLAVVALWRFTPPPRALTLPSPETLAVVATRLQEAGVAAQLTYTPVRSDQPGSLRLILTDGQSAPLSPKAVTVSFANPAHGLEPLRREATQLRPGEWEVSPLTLPAATRWEVRIDMLVTDFDRISLQGELDMAPGKHSH